MTKTCRRLRVGLMMTVGLTGLGRTVSADQTETLTIGVRNTAGAPGKVLGHAQADVTRIDREAGVGTVWRDWSSAPDTAADRESGPTVAIPSRDQAERLDLAITGDAVALPQAASPHAAAWHTCPTTAFEDLAGGNGINLV
jgi:hypothetical protein